MNEQSFKDRTKKLALELIKLVESLPRTRTADAIGRQLINSGTSIGANYRAACRGRSTADVIAKLRIVEEEADESVYWMELLIEAGLGEAVRVADLLRETSEIIAMTVASIKTLQKRLPESSAHRKSSQTYLKLWPCAVFCYDFDSTS
jgi:four helix bundle protein